MVEDNKEQFKKKWEQLKNDLKETSQVAAKMVKETAAEAGGWAKEALEEVKMSFRYKESENIQFYEKTVYFAEELCVAAREYKSACTGNVAPMADKVLNTAERLRIYAQSTHDIAKNHIGTDETGQVAEAKLYYQKIKQAYAAKQPKEGVREDKAVEKARSVYIRTLEQYNATMKKLQDEFKIAKQTDNEVIALIQNLPENKNLLDKAIQLHNNLEQSSRVIEEDISDFLSYCGKAAGELIDEVSEGFKNLINRIKNDK